MLQFVSISFGLGVRERIFLLLFVPLGPKIPSEMAPTANCNMALRVFGTSLRSKISDGRESWWRFAGVCAVEMTPGCSCIRITLHCLSKTPKHRRIRKAQGGRSTEWEKRSWSFANYYFYNIKKEDAVVFLQYIRDRA